MGKTLLHFASTMQHNMFDLITCWDFHVKFCSLSSMTSSSVLFLRGLFWDPSLKSSGVFRLLPKIPKELEYILSNCLIQLY